MASPPLNVGAELVARQGWLSLGLAGLVIAQAGYA